jgi:hypothetical protein
MKKIIISITIKSKIYKFGIDEFFLDSNSFPEIMYRIAYAFQKTRKTLIPNTNDIIFTVERKKEK